MTEFHLSDEALALLEQALETAAGAARTRIQVELAWHLRQRDGARALTLVGLAQPRLTDPRLADDLRGALTARLALACAEIATLNLRLEEAEAWIARARAHLVPALDPQAEGDALMAESTLAKATGERARELAALEAAAAFFAHSADRQRAAVARGRLLSDRSTSRSGEVSLDDWPDGGPAAEAWRLLVQAFDLWQRQPAEAAQLLMDAAQLGRGMGMLRLSAISMQNAGNAWLDLGDVDKAACCFSEAARDADRGGWPALIAATRMPVGRLLRRLGRPRDSEKLLNEALALLRAGPTSATRAQICAELALTLIDLDQDQQAAELLEAVIDFYRAIPIQANVAYNLIRQIGPLARTGQTQRALAAVDEAQGLVDSEAFAALAVDLCEARAELHRHCRKLPPPAGMTAPSAVLHFGQAALGLGLAVPGWKAPSALLSRMADAWAEAGDMAQAYALARQARAAQEQEEVLKTGNPRAVLHLLSFGASSSGEEFAPPGEPPPPAAQPLTARELDIVQLLARSYTNKEIAQALGVSAETVKWHLKGLFSKLDAASRRHAVTRARTLGLVSAEV